MRHQRTAVGRAVPWATGACRDVAMTILEQRLRCPCTTAAAAVTAGCCCIRRLQTNTPCNRRSTPQPCTLNADRRCPLLRNPTSLHPCCHHAPSPRSTHTPTQQPRDTLLQAPPAPPRRPRGHPGRGRPGPPGAAVRQQDGRRRNRAGHFRGQGGRRCAGWAHQ